MLSRSLVTLACLSLSSMPALAADVSRQIEVNAPASEVWAAIGAFCSISDWYPGIDSCSEEMMDGATHRHLKAADGVEFLEKFMEADGDRAYGYAIIESPLPIENYTATLAVNEMGDKSVVVWSSSFMPKGATEDEAKAIIGGIYDAGLEAIQARFAE